MTMTNILKGLVNLEVFSSDKSSWRFFWSDENITKESAAIKSKYFSVYSCYNWKLRESRTVLQLVHNILGWKVRKYFKIMLKLCWYYRRTNGSRPKKTISRKVQIWKKSIDCQKFKSKWTNEGWPLSLQRSIRSFLFCQSICSYSLALVK